MTVYLKPCNGNQTGLYNEGEVTSGNNLKSSSVSGIYHSLALLNNPDHPFPLTKMHFSPDKLRFCMVLSIDGQTYHDFPFPHSVHPIAALHLPAETFMPWFCSHKFSLSSLASGKCFGKPLPLFSEGESFD